MAQEYASAYAQVQIKQMGLGLCINALRKGKLEEGIWEKDSYLRNK